MKNKKPHKVKTDSVPKRKVRELGVKKKPTTPPPPPPPPSGQDKQK